MNALFGAVIKGFLSLQMAQHALGENHGNGAHRRDGAVLIGLTLVGTALRA